MSTQEITVMPIMGVDPKLALVSPDILGVVLISVAWEDVPKSVKDLD